MAQCPICLSDVESGHDLQQRDTMSSDVDSCDEDNSPIMPGNSELDKSRVALRCKHTFHRGCIFQWLLFEFHCPVCRVDVCPNAITSYCRPTHRHLQWWLSDFEEDILHSTVEE